MAVNARARLNECLLPGVQPVQYTTARVGGHDHAPVFEATVTLADGRTFRARGGNKKAPEEVAAQRALDALEAGTNAASGDAVAVDDSVVQLVMHRDGLRMGAVLVSSTLGAFGTGAVWYADMGEAVRDVTEQALQALQEQRRTAPRQRTILEPLFFQH